jgi:cytochrome c oxidase assembly protein subunit 15
MVTVHMFVALAVVALLLDATVVSFFAPPPGRSAEAPSAELPVPRRQLAMGALATLGVVLVQIALGTRVRAALEHTALQFPDLARDSWITRVGAADAVHRTLALVVLGLMVGLAVYARRAVDPQPMLRRLASALALGTLLQLVAGIGLAYLALPPVLQIVHVTLGSLLLGGLAMLVLLAHRLPVAGTAEAHAAPSREAPRPAA